MSNKTTWLCWALVGLGGLCWPPSPAGAALLGETVERPVHELTWEQLAFDALQKTAEQGPSFTPAQLREAIHRPLPAMDAAWPAVRTTPLGEETLFSHAARPTLALYTATVKDARSRTDAQVGTAFVIHPSGIAVTCFHALRFAQPFVITGITSDGRAVGVTHILSIFPRQDLAFIRFSGEGWNALPLRGDAPAGSRVFALGHPLGIHFYMIEGLVSRYENIAGNPSADEARIRMNLSLASGSGFSGGPVLDAKGNALGMIDSKRNVEQQSERYTLHSAIPAAVIRSCMEGHPAPARLSEDEIQTALDPSKNEKTNATRKDVIRTQCPEGEIITIRTEKDITTRVLDPDGKVLFSGVPSEKFRSGLPAWAQAAYDENMAAVKNR